MKTVVILDSEFNSTHPMEAVLDRRGFPVLRADTTKEAINLMKNAVAPVDLVIVEAPLNGSESQTEAAVQIHRSSPEIPILVVSDLSLDKWPEEDFLRFGQLLSGRVDLLVKPLSQASFIAKVNALIYTVSYRESRKLFESATPRRQVVAESSPGQAENASTGPLPCARCALVPQDAHMPRDSHLIAAEMHEKAAQAHRVAAEHHGKEDHLTAHELSRQALPHAIRAFAQTQEAHRRSAKAAGKSV